MRIYSGPMSMFGAKAQIAVLEKGLDAEVVMVPFGIRRRYAPKHVEVERINPKGQVPVLIDGEVEIYDSTQIFEYLEDAHPSPPLWPSDATGRAMARRLEHASDEIFFPQVIRLMSPTGEGREQALDASIAYHEVMEARLAGADFLAGEFGFADIAFFMATFFGEFLGAGMAADNRNLLDWRRRVANRPAVAAVAGAMTDYMMRKGVVDAAFRERIFGSDHLATSGAIPGSPEQAVPAATRSVEAQS